MNLIEAPPPTRKELLQRFQADRPDLRAIWIPAWLLRAASWPLKLMQRVALGSKEPVDVAAAFASERYRHLARRACDRDCQPAIPEGRRAACARWTALVTETPFLLANGDRELFAVLHGPSAGSGQAFVFCHPLCEEKLWSHRVFVTFARELAARGHSVLRFDFMGNGDSDGDFSESSVTTAISDVRCAIDELRRRTGAAAVTLVGLRFGATIASLVAEQSTDVDRLVLWAPIVDGERYMQEMLRTNLATQTAVYKEVRYDRPQLVEMMREGQTVNVDGYEMSHRMYSDAAGIKLAGGKKTHAGPCLIVQIDRQQRPSPELAALAATYPNASVAFAQEEPFWKEIARFYDRAPALETVTADWLGR